MKNNLFLIGVLVMALALSSASAMAPGSSTEEGLQMDNFSTDSSVYVDHIATMYCEDVMADKALNVYIMPNQNWTSGDPLTDYKHKTTIYTDNDGKISPSLIWENPEIGEYDIVIDLNNNSKYDTESSCSDLLDDDHMVGFFVLKTTGEEETPEEVVVEEDTTTVESNVTEELNETAVTEEVEEEEVVEEVVPAEEETAEPVTETQEGTEKESDYVPLVIIAIAILIAISIIGITIIKMR